MQEDGTNFFERLKDYDLLERASEKLHLEMTQENEERLINLHNHITWHSYTPGRDGVADAIFCVMVLEIMSGCAVPLEVFPDGMQDAVNRMQEKYGKGGQG